MRVTSSAEKLFSDEAIVFYKPFPTKALSLKELYKYIISGIDRSTIVGYFGFALVAAVVAMLVPSQDDTKAKDPYRVGYYDAIAFASELVFLTVYIRRPGESCAECRHPGI